MAGGFVDLVVEPPLWLMVSIIGTIIVIYFIYKYRKISPEARPFILGLVIFAATYTIARTIETIRRYWIGSYYDIIDSHFTITGLNLILRLSHYVIAWLGITIFNYLFEKHIIKKGMNKNTFYILTIFSAVEGVATCMLYFTAAATWILFCVISFFFVIIIFLIIFFLYLSKMAIKKGQKIGWIISILGFITIFLGDMLDLPETSLIMTQFMGISLPLVLTQLIHYGTPFLQAAGFLILGLGFAMSYKNE